MIAAIQGLVENHPTQKGLLAKCCGRVVDLVTKFEPFFKIVDIFVSSSPEIAALAWGSIRMVFMVTHPLLLFSSAF